MESPGDEPRAIPYKQKGESNMILIVRFVMKFITIEVKISYPRKRR